MDESYERRAEELEREADTLETASDAVERHVRETREDWNTKKSSEQTPGALDPEEAAPGGFPDDEHDDENPEAPGGSG